MRTIDIFKDLCSVPHGSGNTAIISNKHVNYAKKMELEYVQDEAGNVVMYKPASEGYESHPGVIIQGHMDMVCEKDDDVDFDFENMGLDLRTDGDLIYANGTTLGGDDCIGVALTLAILEDDSIKHPDICAVFTVDEEVGMLGASALDPKLIKGKYLLNLDSEEEGIYLVSCAGGATAIASFEVNRTKVQGQVFDIVINGLSGGHSGTEIHHGRANAIILLGSVLSELSKRADYKVIDINGGAKDNAIARSACARIVIEDNEAVAATIANSYFSFTTRHGATDPELNITYTPVNDNEMMAIDDFTPILNYLTTIPNGVVAQSKDVEGLIETSLNVGILKTEGNKIIVTDSVRSSISNDKVALLDELKEKALASSGHFVLHGDYPAWEYKKESVLRDTIETLSNDLNIPVSFEGIHAGLECGIFYSNNPELDIVSFGPNIYDIHTPKERLSISSTERCYDFLIKLLERL